MRPDSRWLWLHQRLPRRKVLSRCKALHDRRRDERNPAHGHRERTAAAVSTLFDNFLKGDPRALARLITRVENRTEDSLEMLQKLFPQTGRSRVIGVTGSPGAGKSSLVDRITIAYRKQNKTLAVVAVDPSSPFTGGAILGDRIRMQTTGIDPGVYIR